MPSKLHLSVLIGLSAVIWGTLLVVEGVAVQAGWWHPFSAVVGMVLLVLLLFDVWLWRLRIFRGWLVRRPDVSGTWWVELTTDWVDPSSGDRKHPFPAFLVARQTFSRLSLRLYSEESGSEVLSTTIVEANDGIFHICATYRSEPNLDARSRSPIHYGTVLLHVEGEPVERLTGHYWTDRSSRGSIVTLARLDQTFSSYERAEAAFHHARTLPRREASPSATAKLAGDDPPAGAESD